MYSLAQSVSQHQSIWVTETKTQIQLLLPPESPLLWKPPVLVYTTHMECNFQFISQFSEVKCKSPYKTMFLFLLHNIHLIEHKPTFYNIFLLNLPAALWFDAYTEWLRRGISKHLMVWGGWMGCYVEFLMWMCDNRKGLAIIECCGESIIMGHHMLHTSPLYQILLLM